MTQEILTYHYDKTPNRSSYDVRWGMMYIAFIFCPDARANRTKFIVRLHFNGRLGLIDHTKDKQLDTLEQCKRYIENEFKAKINEIGYHLGLWKK